MEKKGKCVMILKNEKISARQLYCMIVVSSGGITCLLSTDISAGFAGNNGWICILLASVLTIVYTGIIISIGTKTDWNYRKYAQVHLGSFLRSLIYFLFLIKYLIFLILTVAVMMRFIRKELLRDVGTVPVFLALIIMILYAKGQTIEARGRLAECMVYFILIPTIVLAVLGIRGMKMHFLLPDRTMKPAASILAGTLLLFFVFSHVDMILFMSDHIAAYHDTKKTGENRRVKRAITLGVTTTIVLNIIYYIIIVGNLSIHLVSPHHDSLIRFVKNIKLSYLMFENQGGLFILFFIISIYFSIFSLTYHTTEMVRVLFGGYSGYNTLLKKQKRAFAVILTIVMAGGVTFVSYRWDYFREIHMKKENRVEIEYRKYADCILIDYDDQKEKYEILLSFRGEGGLNRFTLYETDNLQKIKEESAKSSNRKLDFSHVQVIILNDKILEKSQVYADILDYIEKENELSDNLNVCVTEQSALEFAENARELTSQPGIYISKMIENNIRYAGTKFLELCLFRYGEDRHCELAVFNADSGKIKYEGKIDFNQKPAD